jgi:membrane associated rhomboid family serine protease
MQDGVQACQACRDEVGDQPRTAPMSRAPIRKPAQPGAPVTFSLLAAFVVIYALGLLAGDGGIQIQEAAAQINSAVEAGEWWRVLTATLLHGSNFHLLFNGYALYVLGAQLERGVGSGPFAALYVASGLAGGLAFLFSSPQQVAVGASGAIFGLFGAWFAAAWVNRDTPQGRAGLTQFGLLLLINMALPLFMPGIAWQAHVGGFLAGGVIGLGWARRGRREPAPTPASRVRLPVAVAGVLFVGLLWYTLI